MYGTFNQNGFGQFDFGSTSSQNQTIPSSFGNFGLSNPISSFSGLHNNTSNFGSNSNNYSQPPYTGASVPPVTITPSYTNTTYNQPSIPSSYNSGAYNPETNIPKSNTYSNTGSAPI